MTISINVQDFGAKGDGVTDDTDAINAAVAAAISGGIYKLIIPAGIYIISNTINFYSLLVEGDNQTEIRANTAGILMIKNGSLRFLYINGNNLAGCGWYVANIGNHSPSSAQGDDIYIRGCTTYGLLLDQVQNRSFAWMFTQECGYNIAFANGVANCKFFNCTFNAPTIANVLITMDDSGAFGLSRPGTWSNRECSFYGGIMERGLCNIKTLNPANALLGGNTGNFDFHDYEFDVEAGGVQVSFDDTSTLVVNAFNCQFKGPDDGTYFSSGTGNTAGRNPIGYARINFVDCSGPDTVPVSGYNMVKARDLGMLVCNNWRRQMDASIQDYPTLTLLPYSTSGDGKVTYDGTLRAVTVSTVAGTGSLMFPVDWAYTTGMRGNQIAAALPICRITFTLSNIVGGPAVDLYTASQSRVWNNTVQEGITAGTHSIVYQTKSTGPNGADNGVFTWYPTSGVTAFTLSNINIEYL